MEDEEARTDLEDKCDFLKAKFNEQVERSRGYQEALELLLACLVKGGTLLQCKRCGDGIEKERDSKRSVEGAFYHEECFRCYNCSVDMPALEWYQSEIWCRACQSASEEQLGCGSGTTAAAEIESRLQEIKEIEAVRKEKGNNPFREMERKREEERQRKLELFKKQQRERAEKLEAELAAQAAAAPAFEEAEAAARALAEAMLREEAEKRHANDLLSPRSASEAARQWQLETTEGRKRSEAHAREEAVQAEEVDLEGLKQRRGAELEEIKANRAGPNPFRERERQLEEERRARGRARLPQLDQGT